MSKVYNVLITDDQESSWKAIYALLDEIFAKLRIKWKSYPPQFNPSLNGNSFIVEIERRASKIQDLYDGEQLTENDFPFDLAIIDINLGRGPNGLSIIDKLRELFVCNGIIVISGCHDENDETLEMIITNAEERITLRTSPDDMFNKLFPDRSILFHKGRNLELSGSAVEVIKKRLLDDQKILQLCQPRVSLDINHSEKSASLTISGIGYAIPVNYDLYLRLATVRENRVWWLSSDEIARIYPTTGTPIDFIRRKLKNDIQEGIEPMFKNKAEAMSFTKSYEECILPKTKRGMLRLGNSVELNIIEAKVN